MAYHHPKLTVPSHCSPKALCTQDPLFAEDPDEMMEVLAAISPAITKAQQWTIGLKTAY